MIYPENVENYLKNLKKGVNIPIPTRGKKALTKKDIRSNLESTDFHVIAHTNRSAMPDEFKYSIHATPSSSCRFKTVQCYAKSLLLSNVTAHMNTKTREKITTGVKSNFDNCGQVIAKDAQRVVYGGICGFIEDIDFDDKTAVEYIQAFVEETNANVYFAIFPPTYPNKSLYDEYQRGGCEDDSLEAQLKDSLWWYGNYEVDPFYQWVYIDKPYPFVRFPNRTSILNGQTPVKRFTKADYFILGGYYEGEEPKMPKGRRGWYAWVINPR